MKIVKIVSVIIILIIIVAVAGSLIFVRSTLPNYDGSYEVSGIDGKIEIVRDTYGIPHIFADNRNDLVFGIGYAMAQDRLWQMDILRRVSTGRLSEIFGEATMGADKFARVLGFGRNAEKFAKTLSSEEREYLEAFLKGINRNIETRKDELPLEYRILGYEPDPFKISDILAGVLYQSFLNNHNWKFELSRLSAVDKLGDDRGKELFPSLTYNGPYMTLPGEHSEIEGTPVSREDSRDTISRGLKINPLTVAKIFEMDSLLSEYSGLPSGLVHSNCWAISGKLTESGKPILANDYHMPLFLPSYWYEVHIKGAGIDAMGITLPSFPTILAGHNRNIAWGNTTTGGDTQDIYMEKLNPENGDEYLYRGSYEPFEKVTERIYYKADKEKKYIDETVLISRHGPIINSIITGAEKDIPLLAVKTDDKGLEGIVTFSLKIVEAKDWREFKDALSNINAFNWNWVYADDDGNIGFKISGKVPIRAKGDGLSPAPGWSGKYEWAGFIPFVALPELYNPESGYIVTANNEISDGRYPYYIQGSAFVMPYRAMRIEEMIKDLEQPALYDEMVNIQADLKSKFGLTIAKLVTDSAENKGIEDPRALKLVESLKDWDGSSDTESIEMTIAFEVFVQAMNNLYGNKLDDELYRQFLELMYHSSGVCLLMLTDDSYSYWYDDPETKEIEGRDELILKSLKDADDALTEYFGDSVEKWKWGKLHTYTFKHTLGSVPPFKWLWNIGPFPFPGDYSTVRPGSFNDISSKPYKVTDGTSMRHIIDFGDFDGAKLVITTGQSERWLSPHYDDQTELWMDVEYHPMWMEKSKIEENSTGKTLFVPEEN